MSVTRLPGLYDEIAPGLENMGKMLQQFIQPHREFQLGLRDAISKNPQLMQQLVDMEKNNPGFLNSIHAGGLAGIAGGMQESSANIQDKDNRAAYANMNPQQKAERNAKALGYRSEQQVAEDELQKKATETNIEATQQQTDYYKGKSKAEQDEIDRQNQYKEIAHNALLRIKGTSNLYAALRTNGAVTPEERTAFMSLPEFEKDIKFQQDEYWNGERNRLQEMEINRLRQERGKFDVDDYNKRMNAQRAAEVVDRSGNSVDGKMVYKLLDDHAFRAAVEKWKKPPTDNPEDLAAFSAMEAIRNNQAQLAQARLLDAKSKFENMIKDEVAIAKNDKLDLAQRQEAAEMINKSAKVVFESIGVDPPVYAFDKEGDHTSKWFRDPVLYIKEADPRLSTVGINPDRLASGKGDGTARKATVDEAVKIVRDQGYTPEIAKKLKETYTDAEIGEIRTKAAGSSNNNIKPSKPIANTAQQKAVPVPTKSTTTSTTKPQARVVEPTVDPYDKTNRNKPSVGIPKTVDVNVLRQFISTYNQRKTTEEKKKQLEIWKRQLPDDLYQGIIATIPK